MKKIRPTIHEMDWIETVAGALDLQTNDFETLGQSGGLDYYTGVSLKFMCRNSAPAKSSRRVGVMITLLKALVRRIKFPLLAALSRLNACAKRRAGRLHAEKPDDQSPDHCRAVQGRLEEKSAEIFSRAGMTLKRAAPADIPAH